MNAFIQSYEIKSNTFLQALLYCQRQNRNHLCQSTSISPDWVLCHGRAMPSTEIPDTLVLWQKSQGKKVKTGNEKKVGRGSKNLPVTQGLHGRPKTSDPVLAGRGGVGSGPRGGPDIEETLDV